MKISELVKLLEALKVDVGDVEVTCTHFDTAEAYETTVENIWHFEKGEGLEKALDFDRIRLTL